MSIDSKPRNTLIFLFFFSSGFAALLYQVVWLKYLNLLFGSTTFATAAVLSAFMFGLSLGSWLASKFPKLYSSSLRSYGLIEMGVGVFAILFPQIYSSLKIPFSVVFNLAGPESFWYNVAAFAIAFFVLAIPTALMGATLPLLGHSLVKQDQPVAAPIGLLYGINTVGAVAGIVCSAFLLIPFLGLNATIYVGVIINCTVGLTCFLLGSSVRNPIPEKTEKIGHGQRFMLWLYAVSGFLAIAYEVFWTRILVLHLGSSVYAYAIMLSVFLLGISIGSYLSGKLLQNNQRPLTTIFGWIQIAWAFSILIQIIQFTKLSNTLFFLARQFDRIDITTHFIILFFGSLQVLLVPTILSGALFPTVVKHLWNGGIPVQRAISLSYSYNTVGGILGSLAAGFLLIPAIGTQDSLIVAAGLNLFLGIISLSKTKSAKLRFIPILSLFIFISAAVLVSKSFQVLQSAGIFQMQGSEELVHLEEDIAATVTVEQRAYMNLNYRSLSINGVNVAGSSPSLVAIQKMQGNLPMALFGPLKKKHVLHIGFGSGGTAYAVSLYPNTKITVVELSRSVVRNADQYFRSENHGVVHSPTTQFIYFDGRSFLQNSTEMFDVILSDSIHPRYSGNGSLYTKDYYELVNKRLRDGGVHSQWIPIYSLTQKNLKEILRAFVDVFPNTYVWYINSTINPYIVVTAKKSAKEMDLEGLHEVFEIPPVAADLKTIGVPDERFMIDFFLIGPQKLAQYLNNVDPHLDDRMTVEYESSRIMNRQTSWLANFEELLLYRESPLHYFAHASERNSGFSQQFYDSSTLNLNGQLMFIRGHKEQARNLFQKAVELNSIDHDPYEFSKIGF